MKATNAYLEAVQHIPADIRKETAFTFAVSDKILQLMNKRGMTQKQFAKEMGKTESEIAVWLSGQHNFTLRTLAKISFILREDVVRF